MYTGYFGKVKSYHKDRGLRFVSIARFNRFWSGEKFLSLAPTPDMINIQNEEEYKKKYYDRVLNKLDPIEVYNKLGDNAVLLCYEKHSDCTSGLKFCHRHMVARWLEEHIDDLEIKELE